MKKKILATISLTVIFSCIGFITSSILPIGTKSIYAFSSGSPGGRTNSPGDNSSCIACHTGTLNSGSGTPLISAPGLASGYVPGQTYTITGTISQNSSSRFGFEISPERDLDNSKIGTIILTEPNRTRLVNSNNAVTHNSAGTLSSGSNTWSFDWVAPVSGSGNITFYGAFNATNNNNANSGDNIYTTSLRVNENIPTGLDEEANQTEVKLFPNPTINYFKILSKEQLNQIEIYSVAGKQITSYSAPDNTINVSDLPKGIYFIRIFLESRVITKKLIKN